MACPFSESQLQQLEEFVELCRRKPDIVHHPKLIFFKDYLLSLGVPMKTPTAESKPFNPSGDRATTNNNADQEMSSDEEDVESDVELDMEGVIEADPVDSNLVMGDPTAEPTDEERDKSDEKRSEAMKAFSEQNYEKAIKLYTEAIVLNPHSALLFAKRGQAFLKMNKPNACIMDCTRALELNCDSAIAFKCRGRAFRLLGKFEEACQDLCESLKIDYDEQANDWLNEVKLNAEKLRQHRLSVQRKKEEKEHREKLRRARKAQEARAKAAQEPQGGGGGGFPRGFPGAGGFPGGRGFPGAGGAPGNEGISELLAALFQDPEIFVAMRDPEVMKAFEDVSSNPANIVKYQDNPKVMAMIEKIKAKMPGMPGFGFSGGADGAPGPDFPKPPTDDVGLD